MDLRLLPYSPERDVYRLLGVNPRADQAEIVAACRRMARALHPDRNISPRATQEMQVVNAVRSLLTDRVARAEYDAARMRFARAQFSPPGASAIADAVAPPMRVTGRSAEGLQRTARAAMSALVAGFGALLPMHCPRCQALTEAEYRYCAGCGLRLSAAMHPTNQGERLRP